MENQYRYMVCTRCFTYNHGPYILDALNGFAMQEANYPMVTIIVDDASTDDAPAKIKQFIADNCDFNHQEAYCRETDYALIELAPLRNHLNHLFVVLYLKENHYSIKKSKMPYLSEWRDNAKYHALCEGDDYWTDPLKLQKQFDFMESHPDHSLCFCSHQERYPDGHLTTVKRYNQDVEICPMEDIIEGGGGYMATCSMFFVANLNQGYPDWAKNTPVGDLPMMLVLSFRGNVGYMAETMCTYRLSSIGSWNYRIARSRTLQEQHYRGSVKMWRGFDEWSNMKYHKIVSRIIKKYQKLHLRLLFLYYIKYQFKK